MSPFLFLFFASALLLLVLEIHRIWHLPMTRGNASYFWTCVLLWGVCVLCLVILSPVAVRDISVRMEGSAEQAPVCGGEAP